MSPLRRPLLVLVLALPASCSPPHDASAATGPRDVVVVVLDALPAPALGCYDYERDTSPRIDAFAAGAVRFADAYAPASYTLASTASLFTGLAPGAHGVVGLDSNLLADGHHVLAESLAAAGFRTAAFSCNPHVTAECGFGQGFEHFRHYTRDRFDRHAVPEPLIGDVTAWWDEHAGERRFLYVHLLPPHQPYDPPPPYDALFGADASPREEGMTDFLVALDDEHRVAGEPALRARIRARYVAGLRNADAALGDLLDALDARGADESALVVLLSDHGEGFGEHGRLLHGSTVFSEMTHVPLVARAPGLAAGVRKTLVGTRDLAATLTALVDAPWPRGGRAGFSFADVLLSVESEAEAQARDGDGDERGVVSRSVGNRPLWSLRTEGWTLVEHRASGALHLFERETDPGETRDVASSESALARELQGRLRRRLGEDKRMHERLGVGTGAVDRYRAELRDLGYTGDEEPGDDEPVDEPPDATGTDQ